MKRFVSVLVCMSLLLSGCASTSGGQLKQPTTHKSSLAQLEENVNVETIGDFSEIKDLPKATKVKIQSNTDMKLDVAPSSITGEIKIHPINVFAINLSALYFLSRALTPVNTPKTQLFLSDVFMGVSGAVALLNVVSSVREHQLKKEQAIKRFHESAYVAQLSPNNTVEFKRVVNGVAVVNTFEQSLNQVQKHIQDNKCFWEVQLYPEVSKLYKVDDKNYSIYLDSLIVRFYYGSTAQQVAIDNPCSQTNAYKLFNTMIADYVKAITSDAK